MEWQPIETAPKDGTPIIAHTNEYAEPLIVRFYKYNGLAAWRDWDQDVYNNITHWMPLPTPPVQP